MTSRARWSSCRFPRSSSFTSISRFATAEHCVLQGREGPPTQAQLARSARVPGQAAENSDVRVVRALKSNAHAQVTARLKRLPRKLEKQIPRGLKPARDDKNKELNRAYPCLLYTSPSPRDRTRSRMP